MRQRYLLDTNVISEQTKPQPDPGVEQWLNAVPSESFFLSVITVGELRKGISLLPTGKRRFALEQWLQDELLAAFEDRVLPVTQAIAERCGRLIAARKGEGALLGLADGLIAATAAERHLTVVTRNTRDFVDLQVNLLNPWIDTQP